MAHPHNSLETWFAPLRICYLPVKSLLSSCCTTRIGLSLGISHATRVCVHVCVCALSCVRLFAIPWTAAHRGSSVHEISPGKNTVVGCHFLFQGIFPTEELYPHLLYWQLDSLPLSHLESPHAILTRDKMKKWFIVVDIWLIFI